MPTQPKPSPRKTGLSSRCLYTNYTAVSVLLFAFAALSAEAGVRDSGGGPGVVCRDEANQVTFVEPLDLFEARYRSKDVFPGGYAYEESELPLEQQISRALEKITTARHAHFPGHPGDRPSEADFVRAVELKISRDILEKKQREWFTSIHVPPDLGSGQAVPVPPGCKIEAIGYVESDTTLVLASEPYQKLTTTQKAAFWVHEIVYLTARRMLPRKELGSTELPNRVRNLVALLFAKPAANESDAAILAKRGYHLISQALTWRDRQVAVIPADQKRELRAHGRFKPVLPFRRAEFDCSLSPDQDKGAFDFNWRTLSEGPEEQVLELVGECKFLEIKGVEPTTFAILYSENGKKIRSAFHTLDPIAIYFK
jgi:hypothetical protein